MNDTTVHVSDVKKAKVKELASLLGSKTVMVISVKNLPSAQFQEIKKKLRGKAKIQVVKKSLVNFALDHCDVKEVHDLVPHVSDSTAMLFSEEDAFIIAGLLADYKSPSKAKAGQIAPFDIEVKAGPTDLIPGPDISALSAVGLAPKVDKGKISILKDKVILKEGKEITAAIGSIMGKLGIVPFEIGIDPVAAYDKNAKQVYANIKIDKVGMIAGLEHDYGRAFAFAVDLGIVNSNTLDMVLAKAVSHEGVVSRIISGEPEPVAVAAVEKVEVKETKVEKQVDAAAGL